MMKRFALIFSIILLGVLSFSFKPAIFPNADTKAVAVNWLSWEQAVEKSKMESRKIFVYVYRDNCNWSKQMDNTTFSDPVIVKYLNEKYYPVKFNADYRESVKTEDKVYKFTRKGGQNFHEFTAYITNGGMTTPTNVFISETGEVLQPIPGYKDPETFETIMTYYGSDHYQRTPWSMYVESYNPMPRRN